MMSGIYSKGRQTLTLEVGQADLNSITPTFHWNDVTWV